MIETKCLVSFALRVKQELERCLGLFNPGLGERDVPKRDQSHPSFSCLNLIFVLVQLRHVLPAWQSTQVAQKNQQRALPLAPRFRQHYLPPVQIRER